MGYYAKLKYGSKEIDLSGGDYCLLPDFTPPPPSPTPLMTGGNMLNRYNGGRRVDRSFSDRPMNVPLKIAGDSAAETHGLIRRLVLFIESAMMDSATPLYFVYGESDAVPYEPLWGQQFKYYEIKDATQAVGNLYGVASLRDSIIFINLPMLVGPFAVGKRQQVGSATGGILEHTWATTDGISRGLIIPPARTNKMTNPIFGHGTYDNGWTTGASSISAENTDEKFLLFGSSSMKITRIASVDWKVIQSIDAGNTNAHILSCYVKREDGGTITSADCQVYYGSAKASNYKSVGDGWYLVWAEVTGVAAATDTGIVLTAVGRTLYVDGFQFEATALSVSPLIHGDLLDCSWSGTAHASTSSRTAASWKTSSTDLIDISEGSMTFSMKMGIPYDTAADFTVCADGNGAMRIYYDSTNDKWLFYDGTTTIGSAAAADDYVFQGIRNITVTWGNNGIALYKNGALLDSNATYTPPTLHANFYIGSRAAPDQHHSSTYLEVVFFDRELSATEVSGHYANISKYLRGGDGLGQCMNPIPWVWDNTGDLTFDGCTDGDHDNWGVIGGIPGNVDAKTEWNIAHGGFAYKLWIGLSKIPIKYFSKHTASYFIEAGVSADATASNDDRKEISTPTTLPRTGITIVPPYPEIFDGTVHFFLRAKHSASAGDVSVGRYISTNNGYVQDEDVTCAFTTEWRLFYIGELSLRQPYNLYDALSITTGMNFGADYTTVGSLHIDFGEALLGDMLTVDLIGTDVPGGGGGAASPTNVYFSGKTGYYGTGASSRPEFIGDELHLTPDVLNMIVFYYADDGGTHSLTPSIGLADIQITPRWSIL